jgi:uncharacterized metal-binding protein YceD (DUF177 family)
MRIVVAGIPAAGKTVTFGLHDPWAVEAATVALDGAPEVLEGELELNKASDDGLVKVDGRALASRPATCDRCGEAAHRRVELDISLLYAPESRSRSDDAFDGGEVELAADDLDLGWYEGGALRLRDVLQEALALEVEPTIRCADVEECDKRTDALLADATAGDPGHPALAALRERLS